MGILTRDRAFALVVLLVVAILFVESYEIAPRASWQPYGSAFYPRILLGVIGALSLFAVIRSFLPGAERQPPLLPELRSFLAHNPKIIALFFLFAGFTALLPVFGYIATSIAFLILSFALLTRGLTVKKAIIGIAVAIAATAFVYVVFHYGLRIRLP